MHVKRALQIVQRALQIVKRALDAHICICRALLTYKCPKSPRVRQKSPGCTIWNHTRQFDSLCIFAEWFEVDVYVQRALQIVKRALDAYICICRALLTYTCRKSPTDRQKSPRRICLKQHQTCRWSLCICWVVWSWCVCVCVCVCLFVLQAFLT